MMDSHFLEGAGVIACSLFAVFALWGIIHFVGTVYEIHSGLKQLLAQRGKK